MSKKLVTSLLLLHYSNRRNGADVVVAGGIVDFWAKNHPATDFLTYYFSCYNCYNHILNIVKVRMVKGLVFVTRFFAYRSLLQIVTSLLHSVTTGCYKFVTVSIY